MQTSSTASYVSNRRLFLPRLPTANFNVTVCDSPSTKPGGMGITRQRTPARKWVESPAGSGVRCASSRPNQRQIQVRTCYYWVPWLFYWRTWSKILISFRPTDRSLVVLVRINVLDTKVHRWVTMVTYTQNRSDSLLLQVYSDGIG